jgi:adenosylcobinamide kinase/adenosylcobinamide-phosphate guanylyltransferase
MIVLVVGGTRSGKSELAERLAARLAGPDPVTYVATAHVGDDTFAERVARHRARRPDAWPTVECDAALPAVLRGLDGVVLVDSLGGWVTRCGLDPDVDALCAALRDRGASSVVVTEEVGLGVHPATAVGVRFADVLGDLNRRVGEVADRAVAVVAGRVVVLDDADGLVDGIDGTRRA